MWKGGGQGRGGQRMEEWFMSAILLGKEQVACLQGACGGCRTLPLENPGSVPRDKMGRILRKGFLLVFPNTKSTDIFLYFLRLHQI